MEITNPVGCSVEMITRFFCGLCGNTNEQKIMWGRYMGWFKPVIPDGWHVVDGVAYCDKHKVKIEDA